MDNKELRELIKEILREEFLEEMSTTAGASGGFGPPQVPNAFSGKDKKTPVGWRGEEFGVKSMPDPDDRKTNAVDEDEPSKLAEGVIIREQPSSASHMAFPLGKEIKEFVKSVENYKDSEKEKFITNLRGKLQGKSAKFYAKKDLNSEYKVYTDIVYDVSGMFKGKRFYLILKTKDGNYLIDSDINKKILIYGEEEAPTTQRIQNKPTADPKSRNKVKI